jgi:hypothetical protein
VAVTILGLAQRGGLRWTFDGEGNRTFRFLLTLKVTTAPNLLATAAAVYTALNAAGYQQGQPCPLDPTTLCTEVTPEVAQRRDVPGGVYWEWPVTVVYSSKLGDKNPSDQKDPTLRPPVLNISVHTWTEAATTDIGTGAKVQNSAGDPQVRQKMRSRIVIHFEKNYATFNMAYCDEAAYGGLMHTRNQASWTFTDPVIAPAGYLVSIGVGRIEDLQVAKKFDNATPYAAVTGRIELDDYFWADLFADMGFFYQGQNAYGRPVSIQFSDGAGRLSPTPKFLNGAGQPLPAGDPPVINQFQYYPKADWSPLALPGM